MKEKKVLCGLNLTSKSFDEEQGIIFGIASTNRVDRDGDIVEPYAFKNINDTTIPVLFQHDTSKVIGKWIKIEYNEKGQLVGEAQLNLDLMQTEEYKTIFSNIKKLYYNLSVGFIIKKSNADSYTKTRRIQEAELLEISIVPIGSNADATILSYKSVDLDKENMQDIVEEDNNVKAIKEKVEEIKEKVEEIKEAIKNAETLEDAIEKAEEIKEAIKNAETLEDAIDILKDIKVARTIRKALKQKVEEVNKKQKESIEAKNMPEVAKEISSVPSLNVANQDVSSFEKQDKSLKSSPELDAIKDLSSVIKNFKLTIDN